MSESATVFRAKAKINEIESDFSAFANQLDKMLMSKTEAIQLWADNLETLIDAGALDLPKSAVNWHIKQRLKELGIEVASSLVDKALPAKFKQVAHNTTGKNQYNKELEKPIELLTNGERYQIAEKYEDQARENARRAREIKEELDKDGYVPPEELENPKITARKFTRSVESADIVRKLAVTLSEVADKIEQYAPDERLDRALTKEFKILGKVLEPFKDDRWTKDVKQWFLIQKDAVEFSKNHAATKHSTKYTDAAGVERSREMTSEQVDNRQIEVLEQAAEVVGSVGWLSKLFEWHENFREKSLGERKDKLSPRLQRGA